jgi:hypothetical protein
MLQCLNVAIVLSSSAQEKSLEPFQRFPGVRPSLIARVDFFRTVDEKNRGRKLEVGAPGAKFYQLIDQVCASMYSSKVAFKRSEPIDLLAKRLLASVDGTVKLSGTSINALGRRWLFAEATCAWVMRMVRYDHVLAANPDPTAIIRTQDAKSILAMEDPAQVCSGRTMLIREIVNAAPGDLQIKCSRVGGWFRNMGKETPKNSNHAWVLFDLGDGIRVPADAALGVDQKWLSSQSRKVNRAWIMPVHRESWEFFLAGHHGQIRPVGEENKDVYSPALKDSLTGLTYEEWARLETAKLTPIEQFLRNDSNW